jgi:hypothetical protein
LDNLTRALELSKELLNEEQKGWYGKCIRNKKDGKKKSLQLKISEMEKDVHKVLLSTFVPALQLRQASSLLFSLDPPPFLVVAPSCSVPSHS